MEQTYRCLACLEHTITRGFDTSHLKTQCSHCDSFGRFLNEAVFDQFQAFEQTPPESMQWDRLDREEKLLVSEQIVRRGRTIDEFSVSA
jgi:hypothetical protein